MQNNLDAVHTNSFTNKLFHSPSKSLDKISPHFTNHILNKYQIFYLYFSSHIYLKMFFKNNFYKNKHACKCRNYT